jgi:DNA-binding response OmpR family regulator
METILLVEDEPELARVIARELKAEGYHVEHVANGIAALDAHANSNPDLIVLDWMLPGTRAVVCQAAVCSWERSSITSSALSGSAS